MKIKQLLCLLVLAVSGNAFGNNTSTPPMNITDMANQHFASLVQGIPTQNPIVMEMVNMDNKHMTHPEIAKKHILLIQDAYAAGINAGLMAAGTHMQAAMTAMGNVVKVPRTNP